MRRLISMAAALAFAAQAWGYCYDTNSSGQPITCPATVAMRIMVDNSTLLSDGATRAGSIATAMQLWNAQIGATQFSSQIVAVGTGTDDNHVNEIFFSNAPYDYGWDANTLAVTIEWSSGDQRTQADIIFNTAFTWDSYRGSLRAGVMDVRRVALHELGHVLGLDHPDLATPPQSVNALMNSTISNLDALQADDIAGAQSLYGPPGASQVAPNITSQPVNRTVTAGQPAQFSVNATGRPAPAYRWQRLPAGGGGWSDLADGGNYTGTGTATLSILSTTAAMNGDQFRCVASNSAGSATSTAATLTVNAPIAPVISGMPGPILLSVGDTLSFAPTVTGTQPIAYQWSKNGAAISGATSSTYVKYSVTTDDSGQYALTATNAGGSVTSGAVAVDVRPPVNIVRMVADPVHPRIFAINQNGRNNGSILVVDPMTAATTATINVGKMPTGLSVNRSGTELLVICAASQDIWVIDLQTLTVTGTIPLPAGAAVVFDYAAARVAHGSGNIIYYSDAAPTSVLRVLDRSTGSILQTLLMNGQPPGAGNGASGFGDFILSPDNTTLFAWGEWGWEAGNGSCPVSRFTVNPDGTLALSQTFTCSTVGLSADSVNAPVLVSADGGSVFVKGFRFAADTISEPTRTLASPIYAISPNGAIAVTFTGISRLSMGDQIFTISGGIGAAAITPDYSRLVFFCPAIRQMWTVDLNAAIGAGMMDLTTAPADGSTVLPPAKLQWMPRRGIYHYTVYFGTDEAAVHNGIGSYLGQTSDSSIALPGPLAPGTDYYWSVTGTADGVQYAVGWYHFTTPVLSASPQSVNLSTVAGDTSQSVGIALTSAAAGESWTASASSSWITFDQTSGTTPATLVARFDARSLSPGLNYGSIMIAARNGTFAIPVQLTVDPLALTVMRSAPGTAKVYAISEYNAASYTGYSRAYLLEIDTLAQRFSRVAKVGTGVTDLAIHRADGCAYVTNWRKGSLLAVDLSTFAVTRTYPFAAFEGGRGSLDVYRVAAGRPGRVVTEPEDQWITLSLYDTGAGWSVARCFEREGGGAFDPAGRYYYHGDDNISNASLHMLDTAGDQLSELKSVRPATIVNYYGDRTVIVSENGHRVFWNGVVFDENLVPEWTIGSIICCASSDGRYAFGAGTVYDVARKQVMGNLPISTSVSAFDSVTGQLVMQNGQALFFYSLPGAQLPPVITSQPADQAVTAGNSGAFSVTASGVPAPSLQWQLSTDGGNTWINVTDRAGNPGYHGTTTGTLTVSGASVAMTGGQYRCVAINSAGSAASRAAGLTVQGAPTFTLQPTTRGVVEGQRVGFTVAASGNPAPSYQWQVSADGGGTWGSVTDGGGNPGYGGATSAALEITGTTLAMNGLRYRCAASNSWGSATSNPATLFVQAPRERPTPADFDGDGQPDLLLQNSVTGERRICLMDGPTKRTEISLGTVPTAWQIVAAADFNGDGQTDILWQNTQTGERGIWLMIGTAVVDWASLGTVPLEWQIAAAADFNGDGHPDILFENTRTGERGIWLMIGTGVADWASLGTVPREWRIAGAADFNGDGQTDILFENTRTGERGIWLMVGTNVADWASLGTVPLVWRMTAALDLNGDGHTDVLFENTRTGEEGAWLMVGTNVADWVSLGTVPIAWHSGRWDVAGSAAKVGADFNGDGQADIVWENTATGERKVWLMNGTAKGSEVSLGTVPTAWRIAGAADFNGDGQTDILFENTQTGERGVWLMIGTNVADWASLGTLPVVWRIAAVADFNGDGKVDLLLENTSTGERKIRLMNGTTLGSEIPLGVVATAWQIAGAADFTGDGQTDVLWQNTQTGERGVWVMIGGAVADWASMGTVPVEWQIAAVADFSGDGQADLLWENSVTGERMAWLMSGTTPIGAVSLGSVPTDWQARN